MPTINRKQIKPKMIKYRNEVREHNSEFYGSLAWTRLRNTFISTHPLCSECLRHNTITSAEHVHHLKPWDRGKTDEEKWSLFLDENNLVALCPQCHIALHNKDHKYGLNSLDYLTEEEYKEAHNI